MSNVPVGELCQADAKKDAIHVAIVPVRSSKPLRAGDWICFVNGSKEYVRICEQDKALGIVDPFLPEYVQKDQAFYMFMKPNTITSLRHDWTHPAFDVPPVKKETLPVMTGPGGGGTYKLFKTGNSVGSRDPECTSKRELESIAYSLGIDYDELMKDAEKWLESNDQWSGYTVQEGSESWRNDMQGHYETFWQHFEIVTGKKVDSHKKENFYSCSC